MRHFWVILWIMLITSWLVARARHTNAQKVGDDWLFRPIAAVKAVFIIAGMMGLALAVLSMHASRNQPQALWGTLGCSIWVALCIGGYPKCIWLTQSGLRQRTWYGRWKELEWKNISAVKQRKWDGSNSVIVRGDETIVFQVTHAGRKLFLEEVERRTHLILK
jgi:hypothetical protein